MFHWHGYLTAGKKEADIAGGKTYLQELGRQFNHTNFQGDDRHNQKWYLVNLQTNKSHNVAISKER